MKTYLVVFFGLVAASLSDATAFAEPVQDTPPASKSTLSPQEMEIYRNGEITDNERLAGGLLGTIVGFGTGHIVYGQYADRGGIFTATELGSLSVTFIGGVTFALGGLSNVSTVGLAEIYIGLLSFTAFKVWEIVDVWTLPNAYNLKYDAIKAKAEGHSERKKNTGLFLSPLLVASGPQSPQYGLRLSFSF